MAEGSDKQVSRRERRLEMWGGLLGTAAITGIFVFFMLGTACDDSGKCVSRWRDFLTSPANEIGDTFAGFAGALAFLWIVVTVMLQSRELAAQREQLELQRQESKRMADALNEQVEIQQQQIAFFEVQTRNIKWDRARGELNQLIKSLRSEGARAFKASLNAASNVHLGGVGEDHATEIESTKPEADAFSHLITELNSNRVRRSGTPFEDSITRLLHNIDTIDELEVELSPADRIRLKTMDFDGLKFAANKHKSAP